MIDLIQYPHTKESLSRLLEEARRNSSTHSHEDVSEWCYLFWSKWRSNEDDLFNQTDEKTIDIAIEIGEHWVNKTVSINQTVFDQKQIEIWIGRLQ